MARAFCEWGMAGVELLRDKAAVIVIVDVLSFCTAVDVAVSHGAIIHPFPYGDMAAAELAAARVGAELAKPRRTAGAQFSLSPASLTQIRPGTALLLPSPNGSRLSLACAPSYALAGCLRNAAAVAAAALTIADGRPIAVVPAGEQWPDGSLRSAIEDMLGAGAILDSLNMPCSAEAQVALNSYRAARTSLASLICASMSGQELIDAGFADDVEIAVSIGASSIAPVLRDGAYRPA